VGETEGWLVWGVNIFDFGVEKISKRLIEEHSDSKVGKKKKPPKKDSVKTLP
jgi:hypothetical protein